MIACHYLKKRNHARSQPGLPSRGVPWGLASFIASIKVPGRHWSVLLLGHPPPREYTRLLLFAQARGTVE
jgi:hypothetical protein